MSFAPEAAPDLTAGAAPIPRSSRILRAVLWAVVGCTITGIVTIVFESWDRLIQSPGDLLTEQVLATAADVAREDLPLFLLAVGLWAWAASRYPAIDRRLDALLGLSIVAPVLWTAGLLVAGLTDLEWLRFEVHGVIAQAAGLTIPRVSGFVPRGTFSGARLRRVRLPRAWRPLAALVTSAWVATAMFGLPAVKLASDADTLRDARREYPAAHFQKPESRRAGQEGATYYTESVWAPMPFVVRADFGYVAGPVAGAGGRRWYVWLPCHTWMLEERYSWVA